MHIRATETMETQLRNSLNLVANLKAQVARLEEENEHLSQQSIKAQHFDMMLDAVKENEVVRSAWDRFMVTLRMAGYDGKK